jgi:hypothetical protein
VVALPLVSVPPPVPVVDGGGVGVGESDELEGGVEVGGVVDGGVVDGGVVDGGGLTVDEGVDVGSDRGPVGGGVQPIGAPGGGGGGGGSTVVVEWPSGPTLTTVVGAWDGMLWPGAPEPATVIGPPGPPLPCTTWVPGVVPWPLGTVGVFEAVFVVPANWAVAAKAVATTSPPTARAR